MAKMVKNISRKVGLPPGSLVHIGDRSDDKVMITVYHYQEENYIEKELSSIEECFPFKKLSGK